MNLQLQQRIAQMKKGQIPNGYKKTEFGVFPCDWVTEKTLGDLFEFHGGLGKSREELSEEGIEYLHYGDMHQADFSIVSHEQYSHLPKYKTQIKGNESFLMRDGDVAFLDASEDLEGTSRAVLIDNPQNKPFIAGLHIILGRPKGNELGKYYKQYLTVSSYVKKQFQRLASGFKVYGLNKETLPQIRIAYPSDAKEQAKIAEILMAQERVIDLYGKKIEQLKKLKKIALQKMFPKRGSNTPEWRFASFADDWEQRKLGDLIEKCGSGGTPSTSRVEYYNGSIPFLSITDITNSNGYIFDTAKHITEAGLNASSAWVVPAESVSLAMYASVGKVAILKQDTATSQAFFNMVIPIIPRRNYIYQYLKKMEEFDEWASLISTGTQANLNAENVKKLSVGIPKEEREQEYIGNALNSIDNLITLHQRLQYEETKRLKTLMHLLLTGIVRVNQ